MSLFEAVIIYSALGAPVAMYRFFQLPRPFRAATVISVFSALLLWPVGAARIFLSNLRGEADVSNFDTRRSLDARIIENVNILKDSLIAERFHGENGAVYSSGAEAIERYVGISIATAADGTPLSGVELLSVAGHPDPATGAACLARIHRRRLEQHRSAAAEDAVQSVVAIDRDADSRSQSIARLRDIAEHFGDRTTVQELDTKIYASIGLSANSERDKWIPEQETERALN
ncbi:MAG: hypothetical protein QUS14_17130 [Pyrinomonadaceae bacterium]|nr:hypothetical protein [Pyrinomonadaceae bacterium]